MQFAIDWRGHQIRPSAVKKDDDEIIYCRYATTLVTSEVFNPEQEAREIYMTVILPDTAFISRFAIELGGQLFVAYVREKENAWREYQEAVSQGKTAGKKVWWDSLLCPCLNIPAREGWDRNKREEIQIRTNSKFH